MTALRVALLGYGYAGKTFHAPLIAAVPGLCLVRVASRDAGKVHADWPDVAVDGDPLQALAADDVELVVIATPNDSHAPLARAALDAGKHVVIDKPFAPTLDEARALCALAERRGRLLSVFHNRRWDSDFLAIRAAVDAGTIGRATTLVSHFDRFRPEVRPRWRERAVPGGGVWYDLGPHLIDQALLLFGMPARVSASLAVQRDGAQVDDWAHALLEYDDGRRALLHADMLSAGNGARMTVHGTGGSLVKRGGDCQEAQLLQGHRPGAAGWGEDADPLLHYDGRGAPRTLPVPAGDYRSFYAGVRDALRDGSAPPVRGDEALAVMAVLEAALISARTRCAVAPALRPDQRDGT